MSWAWIPTKKIKIIQDCETQGSIDCFCVSDFFVNTPRYPWCSSVLKFSALLAKKQIGYNTSTKWVRVS